MERLAIVETKLTAIEGRMERLDSRMDGVDTRLRGVETGLATLAERVAHLPSKGFIVWALVSSVSFLSALFLLLDRARALFGL